MSKMDKVRQDDGQVDGLTEVVGGPAEAGQLVVGVHRIVDEDLGVGRAQGLDGREDAGEGGLLDASAVGGAQHHGALHKRCDKQRF